MDSGLFQQVYHIVARIPPAKVVTYGQITLHLGLPRGGRTVGWALRKCPPYLPWHRVVNARGRISGGAASLRWALQRERLEREGIVFDASGRIDLDEFHWNGI